MSICRRCQEPSDHSTCEKCRIRNDVWAVYGYFPRDYPFKKRKHTHTPRRTNAEVAEWRRLNDELFG